MRSAETAVSVRSHCGPHALVGGGGGVQILISHCWTDKEGTFLEFTPQGVTDGSVFCCWWCCCDTAHDETHWQVSQSAAVWAKTGFKSTGRKKMMGKNEDSLLRFFFFCFLFLSAWLHV